MIIPELGTLLLVVDQLTKEKVSVILLAQILDLELLVLLGQLAVVVINFLSNLSHGL